MTKILQQFITVSDCYLTLSTPEWEKESYVVLSTTKFSDSPVPNYGKCNQIWRVNPAEKIINFQRCICNCDRVLNKRLIFHLYKRVSTVLKFLGMIKHFLGHGILPFTILLVFLCAHEFYLCNRMAEAALWQQSRLSKYWNIK